MAMNLFKNMVGGNAQGQDLKAELKKREGQIEKLRARLKEVKDEKEFVNKSYEQLEQKYEKLSNLDRLQDETFKASLEQWISRMQEVPERVYGQIVDGLARELSQKVGQGLIQNLPIELNSDYREVFRNYIEQMYQETKQQASRLDRQHQKQKELEEQLKTKEQEVDEIIDKYQKIISDSQKEQNDRMTLKIEEFSVVRQQKDTMIRELTERMSQQQNAFKTLQANYNQTKGSEQALRVQKEKLETKFSEQCAMTSATVQKYTDLDMQFQEFRAVSQISMQESNQRAAQFKDSIKEKLRKINLQDVKKSMLQIKQSIDVKLEIDSQTMQKLQSLLDHHRQLLQSTSQAQNNESAQEELSQLRQKVSLLSTQEKQAAIKVEQLKKLVSSNQQQINGFRKQVKEYQDEKTRLETQLLQQHQLVEKDKSSLNQTIQDLKKSLSEAQRLEEGNSVSTIELQEKIKENQKLLEQIQKVKAEQKTISSDFSTFKRNSEAQKAHLVNKIKNISLRQVKHQIQAIRDQIIELRKFYDNQQGLATFEKMIYDYHDKILKESEADHEGKNAEAAQEHLQNISALQEQIRISESQCSELKEKLQSNEQQLKGVNRELKATSQKLQELEQSTSREMQSLRQAGKSELESAHIKIGNLEAEISQIKSENSALFAYKEATESQGDNRDQELKAAQDKNIHIITELESLKLKTSEQKQCNLSDKLKIKGMIAQIDFKQVKRQIAEVKKIMGSYQIVSESSWQESLSSIVQIEYQNWQKVANSQQITLVQAAEKPLKQNIHALQMELSQTQSNNSQLSRKNAGMTQTIKQLQNSISSLMQSQDNVSKELSRLHQQKEQLEEEHRSKSSEYEAQVQKLREVASQTQKNSKIDRLQSAKKVTELRDSLSQAQSEIEQLSAYKQQIQNKLSKIKDKVAYISVNQLKEGILGIRKTVSHSVSLIDEKQLDQFSQLLLSYGSKTAEDARKSTQISINQAIQPLNKRIVQLERNLSEQQKQSEGRKAQQQSMTQKIVQIQQQLDDIKEEKFRIEAEMIEAHQNYEQEKESLVKMQQNLQQQVKALQAQNQSLLRDKEQLCTTIQSNQTRHKQVLASLETSKGDILADYETKMQERQERIAAVNSQLAQLKKSEKSLQKDCSELRQKLVQVKSTHKQLVQKYKEGEQRLSKLKETSEITIKQLTEEKYSLEGQLLENYELKESALQDKDNLSGTIKQLMSEIKELKVKNQASASQQNIKNEEVNQLKRQVEVYQNKMLEENRAKVEVKERLEAELHKLRCEIEKLNLEKVEELQRQLAAKEDQFKMERKQLEQKNLAAIRAVKEEGEGYIREKDQVNKEVNELRGHLVQEKKLSAHNAAKLNEVTNELNRLENMKSASSDMQEKMKLKDDEIKKCFTMIQSLKSTMNDLEDGIQTYQSLAEQKEREFEEQKARADGLETQIGSFEQQLSDKEDQIKELVKGQVNLELAREQARPQAVENSNKQASILPLKLLFLKYFDATSNYDTKLRAFNTLCEALSLNTKEAELMSQYKRTKLVLETTTQEKEKKETLQSKFYDFLTSQ